MEDSSSIYSHTNWTYLSNSSVISDSFPWNNSQDIPGNVNFVVPALLQTHYLAGVIYLILTSVIIIIGTIGNTAIIIINIMNPRVNKIGRIFVINAAVSDLCISAVAEPLCILGAIKGESWFQKHWFVCEAVAILCFTTCICSYLSFLMQTVSRYIHICRSNLFYRIYTVPRCIGLCVAIWIVSFGVDSANLLGWNDHHFDQKAHRCVWSRLESRSFTTLVPSCVLGLFLPLATLYFLMFRKIFRCKKRLFEIQEKHNPIRSYKAFREALRSSKTLLVTFVTLTVTWTPPGLLYSIDFKDQRRTELYLFFTMLAHIHACAMFIIIYTMNNRFRDSLVELLTGRLVKRKRKPIHLAIQKNVVR